MRLMVIFLITMLLVATMAAEKKIKQRAHMPLMVLTPCHHHPAGPGPMRMVGVQPGNRHRAARPAISQVSTEDAADTCATTLGSQHHIHAVGAWRSRGLLALVVLVPQWALLLKPERSHHCKQEGIDHNVLKLNKISI
ncbi:UNVERIFIED_CONTAM: hypothetical protein K2H54_004455 [Gekko kuhli]